MAKFPTWSEWKLREDNARKRRVRAALAGTGPELPASAAVCPSTNPRAVRSVAKNGVVGKLLMDEGDRRPDYSFDRWAEKAERLGDEVGKMRSDYESEDDRLEKQKKEKSGKKPDEGHDEKKSHDEKPDDEGHESGSVWERLKRKRQEAEKETEKDDDEGDGEGDA